MPVKIKSTGGGSVTIDVPSTAVDTTMMLPVTNAGLVSNTNPVMTGNVAITGNVSVTGAGSYISVSGNNISPYAMRNRIINGGFDIWQRGTSGAVTTSTTYVASDRWGIDQATSAGSTLSRSTSVPTGFIYSAKVQRNSSSTTTNNIVLAQALETLNSADLAGQTITLSFWARAGDNFSATSSNLIYNIFYGQGTDQSLASMRGNGWTGITNSGVTQSITTTWTRYTTTVTVPAGTTQIGLQFYYGPTGTAGADDAFYITGVQLEVGPVATPFERRPYGMELALCQRYYQIMPKWQWYVYNTNGSATVGTMPFPVEMRTTPTITQGTYTNGQYASPITVYNSGNRAFLCWATATASATIVFLHNADDGGFSAEL